MPGCRLLPFLLLLGALVPATAHGSAGVSLADGIVTVSSSRDEVNDLSVEVESGKVVVRDHGTAGLAAGPGCTIADGVVSCAGVPTIVIDLGPGNDVLRGSTSATTLRRIARGGEGDDVLRGGRGDDLLEGDAGDDLIDGGRGADAMRGDAHIAADTVEFRFDRDATTGVRADIGSEFMTSGHGATGEDDALGTFENVVGSDGGDLLTGGAAENRIEGRAGPDSIRGGGGADELVGDEGSDTFDSESTFDGHDVIYGGSEGSDDDGWGDRVAYQRQGAQRIHLPDPDGFSSNNGDVAANENDALYGIESAMGGNGPDELVGGSGPNVLWGNGGADDVEGGDGADRLEGGEGVDALDAGPGDDRVAARDGVADELIDCGTGADTASVDIALEGTPRPAGCEVLGPNLVGRPAMTGTVRAGSVLGLTPFSVLGDASTQVIEWWSCLTDEAYGDLLEEGYEGEQCERRAVAATYTPTAADVGRVLYATVEVSNAAGGDYEETDWSAPVAAAPVVKEEPKQEQQQPAPSPDPAPQPKPQPEPVPVPRVGPPAVESPGAIAQRLLGGRPAPAGAIGVLRLYTAKRALVLVCTGTTACKARVTLTAGRKRLSRKTLTIAAGTGAVVRLPRGVRKAVAAVQVGTKTAKRTLKG